MRLFRIFLPGCILFLSISSFAQDWTGKVYKIGNIYSGYIIGLQSDTTYGVVMLNNRVENQTNVAFYYNADDMKTVKVYKPTDLKGYKVGDKTYRSINYSGGLSSKKQEFVLEVTPGHLARMIYYLANTGAESDEQWVWYRQGENPVQHKELLFGFAKKMSKLISDCPELTQKVENKEKGYGIMRVFQIVEEYNKWWDVNNSK